MDVFDPYEERGVRHPHALDEPDDMGGAVAPGVASTIEPFKLTAKEHAEKKRRDAARRAKRIRPGFYSGVEPYEPD